MFSLLVICYLFLGGTGAGALTVMGALECANVQQRFGGVSGNVRSFSSGTGWMQSSETRADTASLVRARRRVRRAFTVPDEFFARAWPLCFVALALGMLCLCADLGRPDRIVNLLLSPEPSAIAVGSYALVCSLACSGAFALLSILETPRIPQAAFVVLAVLSIASGIVTMAYTGILLQSMASILFWQTALLPIVFVLSSLSCGVALLFLGTAFVEARYPFIRPIVWLCRADSVVIALEGAVVVAYLAWGLSGEGTRAAAEAVATGSLSWLFWLGLIVCGLAVPFALERFVTHGNYRTQLAWIALVLLVGGFALRLCIVGTADYDVTQMPDALFGLAV